MGPGNRGRIERFIRESFASAYDAHVPRFLPELLALRRGTEVVAACGLRRADTGRLYLETYLDRPIERMLPAAPATPRRAIVEVGHLCISRPGASRQLIAHLTAHLDALGIEWTVFTAVQTLRNAFMRLGIPLLALAPADPARIAPGDRAAWGRYYDQRPLVCAVSVRESSRALQR